MPLSRIQPENYQVLLQQKVAAVCDLMAPLSPPDPSIYPSKTIGFRLRTEFRMWHEGDDINYVMFRREDPRTPVIITAFPIVADRIQQAMPFLRDRLNSNDTLRRKLFQVEFMTSLSGELLISLLYHRKLDEEWQDAAEFLLEQLQSDGTVVSLVGRSRKQKLVLGRDFIQEVLPIGGNEYRYRQYEQAFSQPNGEVNIQMIEWACERASALQGDLLELYCGNGNFTLPLASHFDGVIATELSKTSIRAARANLLENNIDNVQLVRLSAEEVTQAINGERIFRRLGELPKPLGDYNLDTLFVDPPRAGLDEETTQMARRFSNIIYISCNPLTLAQNLQSLYPGHRIGHFALFDQFPYTNHMECGVVLQRQ